MQGREFDIIRNYFAGLGAAAASRGVALGVGDDAAILEVSPGYQLVAAVDTLVAGVHFPPQAAGDAVARRALRVNLSDMAAMGARPRWFTLALTLADTDTAWLEAFSRGLALDAESYGCALVGGDTTRGPLTVSIQILGEVEPGRSLTRAGAEVGDLVYVTGELGAAAAALDYLADTTQAEQRRALLDRYYLPTPRVAEGLQLRDLASAAIDISDGLLADVGHIAEASRVGVRLDARMLPLFPGLTEISGERQALRWALTGGDDYELCFTVPSDKQPDLQRLIDSGDIGATAVGEIVAGRGIECLDQQGRAITPEQLGNRTGYQHF